MSKTKNNISNNKVVVDNCICRTSLALNYKNFTKTFSIHFKGNFVIRNIAVHLLVHLRHQTKKRLMQEI